MSARTLIVILSALPLLLAWTDSSLTAQVMAHRVGSDYRLENGTVRLELTQRGAGFAENLFARSGSAWQRILAGSATTGATLDFRANLAQTQPLYSVVTTLQQPAGLRLQATTGGHTITTEVFLADGSTTFDYRVSLRLNGRVAFESLEATYRFLPSQPASAVLPLDIAWCPGQRLRSDIVLGDQVLYSPLCLMNENGENAMLIAQVGRIPKDRTFKTAMRYYAGNGIAARVPEFSYGVMDYATYGHVYFRHDPLMSYFVRDHAIDFGYFIDVATGVPSRLAISRGARFMWNLFGGPYAQNDVAPQYAPLRTLARAGTDWAFESPYTPLVWHEFSYLNTPCGGTDGYITFDRQRKGDVTSAPLVDGVFFTSWFNNMWTAYGLALFGVDQLDPSLVVRALRVKNLSLLAPTPVGLLPSAFDPATRTWRGAAPTIPRPTKPDDYYYHVPDTAWTAYWWLRWIREVAEDRNLELKARETVDALVALQMPSGAFPTWVAKDGITVQPELKETSSTAAVALFLSLAATHFGEPDFRQAAERALDFLSTEVVPKRKWLDFETLVSGVGPNLQGKDPWTGQYDANTLSMLWAAEAFAESYRQTRRPDRLQTGVRVIDELSLYQHLYDKPWLLGIKGFGGFTAQNRDAEHNDARQAIAAPIYMKYYGLTGREEYFHRGIAALRACYSNMYHPANKPITRVLDLLFPWFGPEDVGFMEENAFHIGDVAVPFVMRASNYNWGPGSAVAATAEALVRYGDVYVDWARQRAFGIDGVVVSGVTSAGGLHFVLSEGVGTARAIRFLADGLPPGKTLVVRAIDDAGMAATFTDTISPLGAAATRIPVVANEARQIRVTVQ